MSNQRIELPSIKQGWAHSTCTVAEMEAAMQISTITAIEADILIGTDSNSNDASLKPMMAHPPKRLSDLSFERFINMSLCEHKMEKHLKLDFKEIEAVQPCLDILRNHCFEHNGKTIFLNADILPGPGRTTRDISVPADLFLKQCCAAISETDKSFAFSLGFKVDVCWIFGHSAHQIEEMSNLIRVHKLNERCGIVLAINARLLAKSMIPFESFLDEFPRSQILCWVGSGEPPITRAKVNFIRRNFERHGSIERVGFDVQTTNFVTGTIYDIIMFVIGAKNLLLSVLAGGFLTSKAKTI